MVASSDTPDDCRSGPLRFVIERRQVLTEIFCWFDPDLPLRPYGIQFVFPGSSIVVAARGEDDTVMVVPSHDLSANLVEDREYLQALSRHARGMRMTWARMMTNQFGYADGVQLDFESEDARRSLGIMLIAFGSCLQIRMLTSGRRFVR
jgi:hypothetical protein